MTAELDDLDRRILEVLRRQGRNQLRLDELAQGPVIDHAELRRRLVRLEMLGFIRTDHWYRITDAGRDVAQDSDGNALAA